MCCCSRLYRESRIVPYLSFCRFCWGSGGWLAVSILVRSSPRHPAAPSTYKSYGMEGHEQVHQDWCWREQLIAKQTQIGDNKKKQYPRYSQRLEVILRRRKAPSKVILTTRLSQCWIFTAGNGTKQPNEEGHKEQPNRRPRHEPLRSRNVTPDSLIDSKNRESS